MALPPVTDWEALLVSDLCLINRECVCRAQPWSVCEDRSLRGHVRGGSVCVCWLTAHPSHPPCQGVTIQFAASFRSQQRHYLLLMWLGGSRRCSGMLAAGGGAAPEHVCKPWARGAVAACRAQGCSYPDHKIGIMLELGHWSTSCADNALSSVRQQHDIHKKLLSCCDFCSLRQIKSDSAKYKPVWSLSWASLGLPMSSWWADASMDPPERGVIGIHLVLQWFCSPMLGHQIHSKVGQN